MGRFIPTGSGPNQGRSKAVWPILLTCSLLVAASRGSFAQTGDSIRTYYMRARSFYIPFGLTESDPRIEVLLHYSSDGRDYRYVAAARPHERRFSFSAPADGWYSFIVQTRDAGGVVTPTNLRDAAPSIRVCVDTQAPVIEEFSADTSPEKLPRIRWKVAETNLKEILVDYRTVGGEWIPMMSVPVQEQGTHTWKPSWPGELEVRMVALDKAGNRSAARMLNLRAADNVSRMPPPQEPAGGGKVMFVNSKTFQLHYDLDPQTIGPSDVAGVDIWKLHPGQSWKKCPEKGLSRGPATVSVDAAGRWGFRLIPRSGAGLAERDPQHGDVPDIWVEVDDKKPIVKITKVTVTQEGDVGYLTVYWKADDAFLRSMPITIRRATNAQAGDWVAVATDLPNTGVWRQKTDDLKLGERCYEFVLKVEAVDDASNVGSNQWSESVKVDLKVPRIKKIEVRPGGAMSSGGQDAHLPGAAPFGASPYGNNQSPVPSSLNGSKQKFNQVTR